MIRTEVRRHIFIAVALFAAVVVTGGRADAQMFECPPPSMQMSTGPYSFECRCPDGSLAGFSGCPQSAQQPPVQQPPPSICPAGFSYCANSNQCCAVGQYCSRYGCTPNGAVECGDHYCNPGYACSRGGGCIPAGTTDCGGGRYCQAGNKCSRDGKRCDPEDSVDCGAYACPSGKKCSSAGCIARDATDCGNKTFCNSGRCSRNGRMCLTGDQVDCGHHVCGSGFQCGANDRCIPKGAVDCGQGHFCESGTKCGSEYQCMARNAIDCGGGRQCSADTVCVGSGAECLTRQQIAERHAVERRLSAQAEMQRKEDREAAGWLAAEIARQQKQATLRQQALEATRIRLRDEAQALELQWIPQRRPTRAQRNAPVCDPPQTIIENIAAGVPDPHPMCSAQPQREGQPGSSSDAVHLSPQSGNTITTIIPGREPAAQDTTVAGPLNAGLPKPSSNATQLGEPSADAKVVPIGKATNIGSAAAENAPASAGGQAGGAAAPSGLTLNPDIKNVVSLSGAGPGNTGANPSTGQTTFASGATFSKPAANTQSPQGIWNRLENAVSFANNTSRSDPNFQQGKQQLEESAAAGAVGCAVGAVIGGGAGAAAGGVPAVPGAMGGCMAGAAAGEATLSAVQSVYSAAQQVGAMLKGQTTTQSLNTSVTNVVSDVADKGSDVIPVSATLQVGGSWGTYFIYAFYTGTPGN